MGAIQKPTIGDLLAESKNYVAFVNLCKNDRYLTDLYETDRLLHESMSLWPPSNEEHQKRIDMIGEQISIRIAELSNYFVDSLT